MTDPYGKVHLEALEVLAGETTAIAVYAALATWANTNGECWPLRPTIAERIGVSVSTVARALTVLRERGVIATRARMQGQSKVGTIYTLATFGGSTDEHSGKRTDDTSPHARTSSKEREQTTMNKEIEPAPPILAAVVDLHPGKLLDVPSTVDVVFREYQGAVERWRTATGRRASRVVLSDKRRKLIRDRLADGFDVDDLRDAAKGWRRSPFHCGVNDRRRPYNSVELVFRDAAHVEQFRDLERDGADRVVSMSSNEDSPLSQVQRVSRFMREGTTGDA